MNWVDRLQEVAGWHQEPLELDWVELESELGTTLPEDYKELCAGFEPGCFSAFVSPLRGGDDELYDLRSTWRLQSSMFERDPSAAARLFAPYEVYGVNGRRGLIQWGSAETAECQYFWLADAAVDSAEWPVVGRWEQGADWHSYPISASEFVYRVIADSDFKPLGVADQMGPPFYLTNAAASDWDPRIAR